MAHDGDGALGGDGGGEPRQIAVGDIHSARHRRHLGLVLARTCRTHQTQHTRKDRDPAAIPFERAKDVVGQEEQQEEGYADRRCR